MAFGRPISTKKFMKRFLPEGGGLFFMYTRVRVGDAQAHKGAKRSLFSRKKSLFYSMVTK
jgi:hypothetical protein